MKLKLVLAGLIASTLALPALAQMSPSTSPKSPSTTGSTGSAGTWYVVQDNSTMKCEVTSLKPVAGGTTKAVGRSSYTSKTEAEAELSTIPDCSK